MNINFNVVFKFCIPFLTIGVITYLFSMIIFFSLPKFGVDFSSNIDNTLRYKNYNLNLLFKTVKKEQKTISVVKKKEYELLSSLTLNAVYSKSNGGGWVIIKENSTSKTHILKKSESFKNYVLKVVYPSYVIFEKNKKEYKLSIKQNKNKFEIVSRKNKTAQWDEKIVIDGDKVKIQRKFLDSYVNNIDKVWNDIKINEVKKNGFILGFKVSKIVKGSMFSKLGLKSGDVITEVNNIQLNNYNKAFKIYTNIKSIQYLNIKILRNNRQMELNYEIN